MTQPQVSSALPLVAPFAIYLVGSAWLSKLPTNWYWFAYASVALASLLALIFLISPVQRKKMVRVHPQVVLGIAVGVVGIALWIGLSHLKVERSIFHYLPAWFQPGERVGFNPWEQLDGGWAISAFLLVRIFGLALVVPVVEELFWRGFLLRWAINPDWDKVAIGTFSWPSCLTVTALFTLAHPEWLAAASYCLLLNGLLYWKRDLWQCIIAHATSNLLLACYVITTDNWWLW